MSGERSWITCVYVNWEDKKRPKCHRNLIVQIFLGQDFEDVNSKGIY